jgi:PAS domain S-box-containing protein
MLGSVLQQQLTKGLAALAAGLALAILLVDLALPLGVAGGVPYVAVVLLGWWFPRKRHIFVLAAVSSVLTVAGYFFSPAGGVPWVVLLNRSLALFAIWVTAVLVAKTKDVAATLQIAVREQEQRIEKRTRETTELNGSLKSEVAERATAEQTLRTVIETAVDGFVIIDSMGKIQLCNPACLRMFGYKKENLVGQNVHILMGPPHREKHDGYLQRYREGGAPQVIGYGRELTARRKDGSMFPVELSVGEAVRGDEQLFVGIIRDITERNRALEKMRRQSLIFEQMSDSAIVTDLHGRIIDWNPAAEKMFGYSKSEALGRSPGFLHRAAGSENLTARIMEGAQSDGRWIGEIDFIRKDGTEGVCETVVVPLHDEKGDLVATVSVGRDLSERKAAEQMRAELQQQLNQAQRNEALGNLAGGIAHDFNNALFPIIGLTELTAAALPNDSRDKTNLGKVLEAAYHARDLVRQILAFSRREKPDRKPVDIREIVHDAVRFLRAGLPTTIRIQNRIEESVGLVLADPTQLYQVIVNLGTNARDAMEEKGGLITINLSSARIDPDTEGALGELMPGHYVRLDMTDDGAGIDQEVLGRIFEPFFTTKDVDKGHGLGLSVVYGIVRGHNGTITVQSRPGHGSTFSVFLPGMGDDVAQTAAVENSRSPETVQPSPGS